MIIHGLNFLKAFNMITDIPTKDDFYSTADDMVNEAWGKIADLAYSFYETDEWNQFYESSDLFGSDHVNEIGGYWDHHRPKLISALTLILQSVEFRLKGLITEISPYLLLSSSSKGIPKPYENGMRSFAQFHSIDAQDLVKVYETFGDSNLSPKFKTWFEGIRVMRNRFMHTVDKNSPITPELIFKCIVYAHNELNKNDDHWIWHRYKYKAKHSWGGVEIKTGNNNADEATGEIFEMLQVHYELTGALHVCSREIGNELFGYDSACESFYCKKCVSVMNKYEYFDSKHIDLCVTTVQKNKRTKNYQCIFCKEKYDVLSTSIWDDE